MTKIERGVSIFLNKEKVIDIDPMLYNLPAKYESIRSRLILRVSITLGEYLEYLNDNEFTETLYAMFNRIMDRETFLQQKLIISFYKLASLKKNALSQVFKKLVQEIPSYEWTRPGQSKSNSGIYPYRNNIMIGSAIHISGFTSNHPDFNKIRIKIEFNPTFDTCCGIQVNKNHFEITPTFRIFLLEKCYDTIVAEGFQSKHISRKDISGFFKYVDANVEDKVNFFEERINEYLQYKTSEMEKSSLVNVLGEVKALESIYYKNKITDDGGKIEKRINIITEKMAVITQKYKRLSENYYDTIMDLRKRIRSSNSERKFYVNKDLRFKSLEGKKEARCEAETKEWYNEIQMYGIESFGIVQLVDSNDKEGLDCLAIVTDKIYHEMKMQARLRASNTEFQNMLNESDINELVLPCEVDNYSFVEFKYELIGEMNHSLQIATHVVCWKCKNNLASVKALDGEYVLIYPTPLQGIAYLQKGSIKVYVVILQEWLTFNVGEFE